MAGRVDKTASASDELINWSETSYPASAIIETARLSIRPFHIRDAPAMAEFCNDENLVKWMTNRFPSPYTLEHAKFFINKFGGPPTEGKPWIQFAISLKEDSSQLVGACGIHPGSDVFCRTAELGYWIGAKYQGKGYATETIAALVNYGFSLETGLNGIEGETLMHVQLHTYGDNIASQKVAEKIGFRLEGVSKGAVYKRGVVRDLVMFGKTREDWKGGMNGHV